MDHFCESSFWNSTLTWYTDNPDFTECFHQTVLVWTPCALLWTLLPYELYQILRNKTGSIPWSILNIHKLIINSMLILLSIAFIGYYGYQSINEGKDIADVYFVTPSVLIATFTLSLVLTLAEMNRGIHSSASLFLFWSLLTFCGVFTYRTRIQSTTDGMSEEEQFPFVWSMIYFPLVFAMLFLHLFSDTPTQCESQSPEESASFASRLIYHWFDGLVWKGYKKPLEQPDLSDLNREDKSQNLVPKFNADWEKSKNRHEISVQQLECNGTDLDNSKNHQIPTKKIVSVLPALIRSFGPAFFFGGTLKAVQDCLGFVGPQILSLLIALVKNPEEETWKGYLYAVVLTVTAIAQTIFMNHYMQYMNSVGLKVRTVIVASVYRKALRISNSARKESTVGEIVNLMAVDAQRLLDITVYLNLIWSAPFQIMLAIYFLYQIIGVAVFAGLAVMIILIPINGILANANKKLQVEQMKNKDKRVKMMNEILSGIKVLKLYAWESSFQENVEEIRKKEVKVLKQSAYYSAGSTFIWTCAPFLVSLASFMTFVLESPENELTPDIAFVALTLFNIMRTPMTNIPLLITQFVQAKVSLKRLNKFLNADELDIESIIHQPTANPIVVENGSFSWAESDPPTLKNIDLNIQPAKLVAVVGQVGAGKTSLISALMAEMVKVEGKVITNGRIAYVPQQAWIQNCSLRNNILFGNNYEASKYKDVIAACDLTTDLMILPGGDSTEIGEKGINLSGGQKQRVSVARAVYADLDIYLFDDPLSAVDSHVGKHIFDKVIGPNGLLKHKTRLLVTHSIAFLPQVDQIIVLRDGYITEIGSYEELLSQKGAFSELLLSYSDDTNSGDDYGLVSEIGNDSTGVDESQAKLNRKRSQMSNISFTSESFCSRNGSIVSAKSLKPADMTTRNQLIEKERSEIGKVKGDVYLYYFRSVGGWLSFFTLLLYVAYQAFCMYGNIWLSKWSATNVTTSSERDLYLGVYGALGAGQAISSLTATVCLALGTINASNYLHAQMLERIMRSPMSYFDTTPLGRIINRFAKDVDTVDNMLPPTIRSAITNFLSALATIIIIANGTPIFLAVAIPIGFFYYWLRNVYVATSRQLKRLESISRSPIYSHFSETLTGASVIRAYGHQQRFISESDNRVDMNQNCYYHGIIAVRWLSVRLESMGNLVVFFAAMFAVIARESLDPGLVGLSISYSLSITQNLNWFLRMTADLETNIVSVERIKDYTQISQEASWETGKVVPVKQWPTEGQIVFDNYQVRYRDDLDLVLKGISCQIKGGEKVGIVGRTGAGKSSLTLGLFRILEAAAGAITIDGINISDLGLHTLRSRLTIIPQDPVLFSGSLRMNIDPFNSYSDQAIWTALEHAHLKAFVQSLPTVLHYQVSEGGENLSVGQRQLICLARALLRKTKVLVLDEATAAVDLETDDLIQATIRKEFKECTVLTIAHRLKTIMDSNRVMVLGQGEIKEFAPPSELLADKKSIFYGMAKDAGLV